MSCLVLKFTSTLSASATNRWTQAAVSGSRVTAEFFRLPGPDSNRSNPQFANFAQALGHYFNFAYSDFAATRIGMSVSASFHRVKKSWYADRDLAASPASA